MSHPLTAPRPALAFALLVHLGVNPDVAEDLLWYAIQLDGAGGPERVLLAIAAWAGRQERSAQELEWSATMACARDTIAQLEQQIDALTGELRRRHRDEERSHPEPLRVDRAPQC